LSRLSYTYFTYSRLYMLYTIFTSPLILCWKHRSNCYVLEAGVCPYFLAVPNHGHVLRSRVLDLCLFLDILDIMDLFWTFAFQTPVSLDWLCLLRVA
jgi:hypothetical protein